MQWVNATRPTSRETNFALFYRGHSDSDYTLEPTVFRKDGNGMSYRAVENLLYGEMLRLSPQDFRDDKNVLERLVRMQHHGLPTRLLDLTQSPLIALYFSCLGNAQKDGEVIFLPRERAGVSYASDLPASAFVGVERAVNLSQIVAAVSEQLLAHLKEEAATLSGIRELDEEFLHRVDQWTSKLAAFNPNSDLFEISSVFFGLERSFIEHSNKWDSTLSGQAQSYPPYLAAQVLVHKRKNRLGDLIEALIKSACSSVSIEHNDEKQSLNRFFNKFTHYHFVYPPINNERIRRQQGAFIVCPPGRTLKWGINDVQLQIEKIRISSNSKDAILKDLSYLGITHSYVFPDLNSLAQDVKRTFPVTLDAPVVKY